MKSYEERLKDFEADKKRLYNKGLSFDEFHKEIRKLAEKHKV